MSKAKVSKKGQKQARYPWLEWFKAKSVTLARGRDYYCTTHGMWRNIKEASAREGYRVSIEIQDNDTIRMNVVGKTKPKRRADAKPRRQPKWVRPVPVRRREAS